MRVNPSTPEPPAPTPSAAPLDLDALERLATAVKADIAEQGASDAWVKATTLTNQNFLEVDAEFIAACSPDVILALLASVRGAEAETAPLRAAVDAFLLKHPAQIGSKSGREDYGGFVTAADLWALHEARLDSRREMERNVPAFADLPPESRDELEEFAAHLRTHRDVAKLDCRFCLLRLTRAAARAHPPTKEPADA